MSRPFSCRHLTACTSFILLGEFCLFIISFNTQINAAGLRYRSLLKQWTTHVTLTPTYLDQSDAAYFNVRGFYGDYNVVLQLPNGQNSSHSFTLDPGNDVLNIQLNLPGSLYSYIMAKVVV